MNNAVLALIVGYAALGVLLLNLGLYTRWPAWLKTLCILLFGGLLYTTYAAMNDMLGWPTRDELPPRFMMLSAWVNEPDKESGSAGSIHLWAVALTDDGPAVAPRAFELDYDRQLHSRIDDANRRMGQGLVQVGQRKRVDAPPAQTTPGKFTGERYEIELYNLPDPELPEK